MSGVSKVYQSVSNAMCRKRSNHKGLRAFRPGFDSPRSHLKSPRNGTFFVFGNQYDTTYTYGHNSYQIQTFE